MERASGILLPVFSLPGEYGIGTFGKEAYKFVDFLKKSKQKYWQVLPLGETGCGNCSTAAALIGLAECKSPIEILAMANISAAYNAKQYGPWKRTDEKTRMEAEALKAKIMAKNQKNAQDE